MRTTDPQLRSLAPAELSDVKRDLVRADEPVASATLRVGDIPVALEPMPGTDFGWKVHVAEELARERRMAELSTNHVLRHQPGTVLKIYRHLTAQNREAELLRHLGALGASYVPTLRRCVDLALDGRIVPLAVEMDLIRGAQSLGAVLSEKASRAPAEFLPYAASRLVRLGELVAQLHRDVSAHTVCPIPAVDPSQLRRALAYVAAHAARALQGLPELRAGIFALNAATHAWHGKARVHQPGHGDMHLGQVLASEAGQLFLTDFEGETPRERAWPSRELAIREYDLASLFTSVTHFCSAHAEPGDPETWPMVNALYAAFELGYERERRRLGLEELDRELIGLLRCYRLIGEIVLGLNGNPSLVSRAAEALRRTPPFLPPTGESAWR